MEVRRGMHSFIEIFLLNVSMTIDVDDANVFGGYGCQSSDGGETNGVIAGVQLEGRESVLGESDGYVMLVITIR